MWPEVTDLVVLGNFLKNKPSMEGIALGLLLACFSFWLFLFEICVFITSGFFFPLHCDKHTKIIFIFKNDFWNLIWMFLNPFFQPFLMGLLISFCTVCIFRLKSKITYKYIQYAMVHINFYLEHDIKGGSDIQLLYCMLFACKKTPCFFPSKEQVQC